MAERRHYRLVMSVEYTLETGGDVTEEDVLKSAEAVELPPALNAVAQEVVIQASWRAIGRKTLSAAQRGRKPPNENKQFANMPKSAVKTTPFTIQIKELKEEKK